MTPDFFLLGTDSTTTARAIPLPLGSLLKLQSPAISYLIILSHHTNLQNTMIIYPLHVEKVNWTWQGERCGFESNLHY